ncbi:MULTISPECIES: SIR2 family protein [Halorhodospira]|uniref:SIR2 family protein n=1 Tax=Halorhodospira TaxID=85108 RepID=UPI001EE8A3EE|nr:MULTISPECIES: SIR2 family protein [Halorhodospira]MCG5526830.1 SIR2 family protein [Halorhodospira halophila]MCG5542833.1 SIR2 family protein [Halorhodospira sp. 9628]
MKLTKLGITKQANVLLGAGASRGASCFHDTWAQSPLDTDFFDQIDRLKNTSEGRGLSKLVEFARKEFGVSERLAMEPFFTQLESLNEFHATLRVDRGRRVKQYEKHLENFSGYLASTFRALRSICSGGSVECEYHKQLASALRSGDSIISYNYDCIIDSALKSHAGKKWSAATGYGIEVRDGAEDWSDHSGPGRIANKSIRLLKVHGSLNWRRHNDGGVSLRRDPYEDGERSRDEVVPPVWNKRISEDTVLGEIWKQARNGLRTGPILVVVGYSVPNTDLLSQVLLRVAAAEGGKTLTHLIIVNPDSRARRKLMSVLHGALTNKTTIIELDSWTELVDLL